jgi:hypothetical protein
MRASLAILALVVLAAPSWAQDKRKLLETTGWGTLSGKVTFEGKVPAVISLVEKMKASPDAACCLPAPAAQKVKEEWVIDPKTKGVANVFVWLKPPVGTYFPIHADDKARKKTVMIDQPYCTFLPHAVVLFPEYFDGSKKVATGEKFVVKNSAKCVHSVRINSDSKAGNIPQNVTVASGKELGFDFKAQKFPISVNCAFHSWMEAYVGVYDHPYATLTNADGTFTMPRVPAGAEVVLMAWHEKDGVVLGAKGKAITLKAGANTFDFTIKAK